MSDNEGGNSQTTEEILNPLDGGEEVEHKHPGRRRAGAHAGATAVSEDELANMAQEVESTFSTNLERQKEREVGIRDLKARLENRAGDENHEVNKFLGTAKKTGKQELADTWSVDSAEYLTEETEIEGSEGTVTEPIEFAEEGQELQEYFQKQSGAIDKLSSQVNEFTKLINRAENKEEEEVSDLQDDLEQERTDFEEDLEELETDYQEDLEELETEYENTLSEIESEKDDSVEDLKEQVGDMSTGDVEGTDYEESGDMWSTEWDDIVTEAQEEKEEAESEYEEEREQLDQEFEQEKQELETEFQETKQELQGEIQSTKENYREQRSTLRDTKQDAVSQRADRLDELEEVHAEFSNDVAEYVEEQTDSLTDLFLTMRTLGNMRDDYNEDSVEAALEGSAELNQDQQAISEDLGEAAGALAYRALQRIDNLEDAVGDYASAVDTMTQELDNQKQRVGTQLDDVTGVYDDLLLDSVDSEGEYGIEGLRERVMTHVSDAAEESYDAVDEFREEIESMARAP